MIAALVFLGLFLGGLWLALAISDATHTCLLCGAFALDASGRCANCGAINQKGRAA